VVGKLLKEVDFSLDHLIALEVFNVKSESYLITTKNQYTEYISTVQTFLKRSKHTMAKYAKDQPAGFVNHLKDVAIVGVRNRLPDYPNYPFLSF
jgi:hypothetical protein